METNNESKSKGNVLEKIQKINALQMQIEELKHNYLQNKIFLDVVHEVSKGTNISNELSTKVKDVILREDLIQFFTNKQDKDCYHVELNQNEANKLKFAIEQQFVILESTYRKNLSVSSQKCCAVIEITIEEENNSKEGSENLTNEPFKKSIEKCTFMALNEKMKLIEEQTKLNDKEKVFVNLVENFRDKLAQFANLKTVALPQKELKYLTHLELDFENYIMRMKLLFQEGRILIFQELPFSTEAYKKVMNTVNEKENLLQMEIYKLRSNLTDYKNAMNDEKFVSVLNEFRKYRKIIDRKLWMKEQLIKKKLRV